MQHHQLERYMKGGFVKAVNVGGRTFYVMKGQPTPSDVHVNAQLTNISVMFSQNSNLFVADRVFPTVSVAKQSDFYRTFGRGFFNRHEMKQRAPSTRSPLIGWQTSTDTYTAAVYSIGTPIDDQMRANADSVIGPDRIATSLVTTQGLLNKEINWVTRYFQTGVWTNNRNGVASGEVEGTSVRHWSDPASDPIGDVSKAKTIMLGLGIGVEPNKLTIGRTVWDSLKVHPDILARVSGGSTNGNPAMVTKQLVAQLFEVEEILIMGAVQNTAAEIAGGTDVHSFIGGKHALLSYAPPSPGLEVPSAGYTFAWTGLFGASALGGRINRFREEPIKSDIVELELAYDQKVISADCGFFFNGVVI